MPRKAIDETGKKYNSLTVIREATEEEFERKGGKGRKWLCRCDCGKLTFADGRELRNGRRVSCGCVGREKAKELARNLGLKRFMDLTGRRFGRLTVIKLDPDWDRTVRRIPVWICQCDCGSISKVQSSNLLTQHTQSCGCLKKSLKGPGGSLGEEKIVKLLNANKISFEREKTFPDLKGFKSANLRYDFYLPDYNGCQILIEFQGLEHYKRVPFFQETEADFQKRQIYDEKKISYSLAKKIHLYCIPYWELDGLQEINDLFQEKFLAKSKDHNYFVYRNFLKSQS